MATTTTATQRKRKMTLDELIPKDSIAILGKVYDEAKAGTKQLYELQGHQRRKRIKQRESSYAVVTDRETSASGWIISRSQMRFLSEKAYLYNASAGSYLEVWFLQK